MDSMSQEARLVCVLFPGIVKNDEKALECMGGIRGISEAYSYMNKKRLGLTFQPDNPFINKVYADISKTSGVLLKVRIKKKKSEGGIKREVISTNVVGRVTTIFKFEGMGDFQYLPIQTEEDKKPLCIQELIVPNEIATVDFFSQSVDPYVTPTVFTRTDKPSIYHYTCRKPNSILNTPVRGSLLSKPPNPTFVKFTLTDEFPTGPTDFQVAAKDRKMRQNQVNTVERVRKAFEERPIWSMNAIVFNTQARNTVLRFILPAFAMYFTSGPWRKCWTRYGYDPRKEPESRIYQVLDFRVKGPLTSKVSARVVGLKRGADRQWSGEAQQHTVRESHVIFRPGSRISQRQIYFHYCDIHLPEVQEVVRAAPAAGMLCHELSGWLPAGFADEARAHLVRYSRDTLITRAGASAGLKAENTSSEEEHNSDVDPDDADHNVSGEFDDPNT